MTFRRILAFGALTICGPTLSQELATGLLGTGGGVDHVGIVVRDISKTQADFEKLGFKVHAGGHFPDGSFNAIISFENESYLELLSYSEGSSASDIVDFAKKHEGAYFLGLNVSSAQETSDYLKARDFDASSPEPGTVKKSGDPEPPPTRWYTVGTADKPAADKLTFTLPIFFIQYLEHDRSERLIREGFAHQPNTATKLKAVWFAVHDGRAQRESLIRAGFASGRSDVALAGAHGSEVQANAGRLVVLESDARGGLVRKYWATYQDDGILGLSIEVSDLDQALKSTQAMLRRRLPTYKGAYGRSVLLPEELTHGVLIELVQVDH